MNKMLCYVQVMFHWTSCAGYCRKEQHNSLELLESHWRSIVGWSPSTARQCSHRTKPKYISIQHCYLQSFFFRWILWLKSTKRKSIRYFHENWQLQGIIFVNNSLSCSMLTQLATAFILAPMLVIRTSQASWYLQRFTLVQLYTAQHLYSFCLHLHLHTSIICVNYTGSLIK